MAEASAPLPPYAVRAKQQEARRQRVLAQRQAERERRRSVTGPPLNSAKPNYDPSEVAKRRNAAIAAARRRREPPQPLVEAVAPSQPTAKATQQPRRPPQPTLRPGSARQPDERDESPPPPSSTPPESPRRTRFFENANDGVVIFRGGTRDARPEVDDADDAFRAMLREDKPRDDKPPPRRRRVAPPKPKPKPPPRKLDDDEVFRSMLRENQRPTERPVERPTERSKKAKPLCMKREKEERKRAAEHASEGPETRRCLDKRTARLRFMAHFAAGIAAYRACPEAPPSDELGSYARVVVRVRPMLGHEAARGDFAAVSADLGPRFVTVHDCTMHADMIRLLHSARRFPCHAALGPSEPEDQVYAEAGKPALEAALKGTSAALFMFGQTGSGKTHTMGHLEDRMARAVFRGGGVAGMRYFEIRGNKAFDLLSDAELRLVDEPTACRTEGAAVAYPTSPGDFLDTLREGRDRRATAATDANGTSSRSHAVCVLDLARGGSLTLVDCAGSERSHDSMYHDAQRRKESTEINQSIYALKSCIRACAALRKNRDKPPPPFRSSALTRVLRHALQAPDAHLCVIATVSPAATDAEHSIATLRTVCELAGCSSKYLDSCVAPAVEVPKIRQPRVVQPKQAASNNTNNPRAWSNARLAAFLDRHDPAAATRLPLTNLDANNLLRMSTAAVAAALTDGDTTRATKLIGALKDHVGRSERLRRK